LSQTDKEERIRKFSLQKVETQVLAVKPDNISVEERETFLKECNNKGILEKVVNTLYDDLNTQLLHSLVIKLDKRQVTQRVFFKTQNVELQKALLDFFDDENALTKVIKRVNSEEIITLAQQKVEALRYANTRPVALEKDVRLVLSKLLALKDIDNFDRLKESRGQLLDQYKALSSDFHFLTSALLQEIETKYQEINQKLDKQLDDLSIVWKEQQAAIALENGW
jgi:hypothetical protein